MLPSAGLCCPLLPSIGLCCTLQVTTALYCPLLVPVALYCPPLPATSLHWSLLIPEPDASWFCYLVASQKQQHVVQSPALSGQMLP